MNVDFDRLKAEMEADKARTAQSEAFGRGCSMAVAHAAVLPVRAWLFMLGVGAAHGAAPAVPTVGFGTALLVMLGVGALVPPRVKTS
ncbi:hypothetical protein [Kitasatospora fiedleri]|uniref:hypothetical protein n=1 Tax=Kitasatospora fiedleri TaxID=2991545 RepID=UPI002499FD3C|nr:hypothetical protein [Kitasatospora fiedleri]